MIFKGMEELKWTGKERDKVGLPSTQRADGHLGFEESRLKALNCTCSGVKLTPLMYKSQLNVKGFSQSEAYPQEHVTAVQ